MTNLPGNSSQQPNSNQGSTPYPGPAYPQQPQPGFGPTPTGGYQPPTQPPTGPTPEWEPEQAPENNPPKQKRSVGLGTALALMLVAAVAAGAITGVVTSSANSSANVPAANDGPANALEAPSADAPPAPEGSVEEVAAAVLPTVVSIQVATPAGAGEGSGSIITQDGYVLTNHHVIAGADTDGIIQVTLNDGQKFPADFVASDPATDIGVIKIRDVAGLPTIQFGDSNQISVGQQVVAVGAPLGLSGTVTSGIVSAVNRPVRAAQDGGESSLIDAIQTDAPINPGNSGGPLVDMNGHLIGMNSVIATASSSAGSIGLGFAIPSNFAQRVATQLIETGQATQPMLGVTVSNARRVDGAPVVDVTPGGPADQAGIQPGDIVTRINDRSIDTPDALIAAVRSYDFGETVELEIVNPDTNESRTAQVTLTAE